MNKSNAMNWILARWSVFVSAGVLGVTALLSHSHASGPPCLLRMLFRIPCPGCGMTRSLEALWRGDLLASIRYHPLGPPLFLLCCLVLLHPLLRYIAPRLSVRLDTRLSRLNTTQILYASMALLLCVWLLRLGLLYIGNSFFQWNDIASA